MKTEIEITVTLRLTEREANWLREQMQNPLHKIEPLNEATLDKDMRHRFFSAIPKPLINRETANVF